ncbi:MAG: TIR domain-containing protein [Pseudonocardiaceae bacterium]
MRLFVSYSSKDNPSVKSLIRDLEAARHAVWVDQELTGGDSWWREILQQIRQCDVFVLALSNNSLRSKPCIAELEYAKALGLPVVPVQIAPVERPRLTPIAQIQMVDYRNPTAAAGMALVAALQDGAARRGELPDPLPAPPPIPYEYLMRLSTQIDSSLLQHTDQLAIVAQLRDSLQIEDDEGVQADLSALLRRLRSRSDVTFRAASEIDALLRRYDDTAKQDGTARSTSVVAPPQPTTAPNPSPGSPTAWSTEPSRPPDRPQQHQWTQPQQWSQWDSPSAPSQVPPLTSPPPQPASQQIAIWGIALGAAGLLVPFIGMGGIVCAGVAKSRKQPLADAALAVSIIATLLGLLIWTSFAG